MSKYKFLSQNISKAIIFFFVLGFGVWSLGFVPLAHAVLNSTTYSLKEYDFGSGGKLGNTSTSYSLYANSGQLDGLSLNSTDYTALPGLTYQLTSNVPGAPTVSNNSGIYYNQLSVTLNTSGNPSDTLFAIKVVSTTTKYVQADDTLGANPVWQTNTTWGASGFQVIGLNPGTSYTFSVSAKQGTFTESSYGPTTTVATATQSMSFSLSGNSLTFPALVPGTVSTSTTTITATITTNGTNGATVYAKDSNGGLHSTNTAYTINSTTSNLSSASEGYGLQDTSVGQTSGGPMETLSPYNGSANNVGLLNTTLQNIFDSSSAPVTSGTGTFELQAKAGNTADAASDYTDTLTVIASAQF